MIRSADDFFGSVIFNNIQFSIIRPRLFIFVFIK
jgi:hypothetical protein